MAGNAHRTRPRSRPCTPDCMMCNHRPKEHLFRNHNGHRHNPTRKRRGKRPKKG